MNLWFRSVTEELCSWSIVLDELCKACKDLSHTVRVGNISPRFPWQWVEVWWGAPQDWRWSYKNVKARVAISLSESDQIQKSFQPRAIENLKDVDILFITSETAKRAFLEMPIDVPIALWPLGVNPEMFPFERRDFDDDPFSFLLLGATQFRKGSWLAVEAFVQAFDSTDSAKLTVASHKETTMFTLLQKEYDGVDGLEFVLKEHRNPARHYQDHHVLLSPHLGEGWGMCITEAMSVGMACIVSRCSTPREYFSKDFGWWIEMSDLYSPVSDCFPGTAGYWRLPSVLDMADKMRYAYEHRAECKEKALAATTHASHNLTWGHGAKQPLMQIEKIL